MIVDILEAKAQLSKLIDRVYHGEKVVICSRFVSIAAIVCLFGAQSAVGAADTNDASASSGGSWDYQAPQDLVAEARSDLQRLTAEMVNGLAGKEVRTPWWTFTAEGFLMSFSLPSFYFHAATAYDILRTKGVPVGKLDFLGSAENQDLRLSLPL